jgi:urease accessory protein
MKSSAIRHFVRVAASMALLATSIVPAFAHHMTGGRLPASFQEGLLSGLGHPVIGVDHLAFMIGVGIASAFLSRGLVPIAAFVLATIAGCALHLQSLTLPAAEIVVAASVVIVGAAIMSGRGLSAAIATLVFAAAGLFHGYAYGESIFGAEQTPLAAYLLGFAAIQFVVAFSAMLVTRAMVSERVASAVPARLAGAVIAGIGLTFLAQNVESVVIPAPAPIAAPSA